MRKDANFPFLSQATSETSYAALLWMKHDKNVQIEEK